MARTSRHRQQAGEVDVRDDAPQEGDQPAAAEGAGCWRRRRRGAPRRPDGPRGRGSSPRCTPGRPGAAWPAPGGPTARPPASPPTGASRWPRRRGSRIAAEEGHDAPPGHQPPSRPQLLVTAPCSTRGSSTSRSGKASVRVGERPRRHRGQGEQARDGHQGSSAARVQRAAPGRASRARKGRAGTRCRGPQDAPPSQKAYPLLTASRAPQDAQGGQRPPPATGARGAPPRGGPAASQGAWTSRPRRRPARRARATSGRGQPTPRKPRPCPAA